jgi:hypothetical protein
MELASLTDLVDLDFGGRSPRAPFGEGISSDFFFFSEALRRKDMVDEGGWGVLARRQGVRGAVPSMDGTRRTTWWARKRIDYCRRLCDMLPGTGPTL